MSWGGGLNWGLQTGLMVSFLIVFILIIRRPFAKTFGARATYALWALPIMRLFLPTLTLPAIYKTPLESVALDLTVLPTYTGSPLVPSTDWLAIFTPWMIAIWALGAIGFVVYHYCGQTLMQQKMNPVSEGPSPVLDQLSQRAAQQTGLKSAPKIRLISGHIGPMVSHLFPPIIYLPQNFEESFSPEQQKYALLHEMAHIRRGDLWAAWGWLIFRAINWPNPLVHWASRAFRSDQEAACDATVLALTDGQKTTHIAYAQTLLRAAEAVANTGRASPATPVLTLTIHQPLKERLIMLTREKTRPSWLIRSGAAALIIAAFGLTAPLTMAQNHPDDETAQTHEKHVKKSVMKWITKEGGKQASRHIEVIDENGNVTAFEIDDDGNRSKIDPYTIEGFDVEKMRAGQKFQFDLDDIEEGKIRRRVYKHMGDGTANLETENYSPRPPHAPLPPGAQREVVIMEMDDENYPYNLKSGEIKLRTAESLLEAAEEMISEMDSDGTDSRKLVKARKDIERGRKSLAAAQSEMDERQ